MVYIKLILTAFFWGGTFIAGKWISHTVDPYSAAFLRFAIASFFLVVLTRTIEGKLPAIDMKQAGILLCLGLTGILSYNILFFTGLSLINANRASLIIATNPIFISLISALIFKEKLTPVKLMGLGLSVSGAIVVISGGHITQIFTTGVGAGELAIFGCVASWVTYSILGKFIMGRLSPLASVCYSSVAGTLLLLIPALYTGTFHTIAHYSITDWSSLFYLGFFGTVLGFYWYYQAIQKIGPLKSGVFINFVPLSALILAFFFLDEPITPAILAGAALIISGVLMTNAPQRKKK